MGLCLIAAVNCLKIDISEDVSEMKKIAQYWVDWLSNPGYKLFWGHSLNNFVYRMELDELKRLRTPKMTKKKPNVGLKQISAVEAVRENVYENCS